jgi:hypothetical protein
MGVWRVLSRRGDVVTWAGAEGQVERETLVRDPETSSAVREGERIAMVPCVVGG